MRRFSNTSKAYRASISSCASIAWFNTTVMGCKTSRNPLILQISTVTESNIQSLILIIDPRRQFTETTKRRLSDLPTLRIHNSMLKQLQQILQLILKKLGFRLKK